MHVHAGEFDAAAALIEEADAIDAGDRQRAARYASLMLAAWRGEEAEALRADRRRAPQDATARGEGMAIGVADYATAVLHNGLGRYERGARRAAQRRASTTISACYAWALVELVEAAVRSGAASAPRRALERLERTTRRPPAPTGRSGSRRGHARC